MFYFILFYFILFFVGGGGEGTVGSQYSGCYGNLKIVAIDL